MRSLRFYDAHAAAWLDVRIHVGGNVASRHPGNAKWSGVFCAN